MARCNCPKLKKLYGERLFRCNYAICQTQQIAFKTRADRDAHCKNHDRAYKCPHPSCGFSTLGYPSSGQLNGHMENCHPHAPPKFIHIIENPDEDEVVPLLLDMIAMGKTAEVKALCPKFHRLNHTLREKFILEAAFSGSLQILQCLLEQFDFDGYKEFLIDPNYLFLQCANESIKGENIEVLQWVIPHVSSSMSSFRLRDVVSFMHLGAFAESAQVFETWKMHLKTYVWMKKHLICEGSVLGVKDPVKQERLASVLSEQASLGYLTTYDLSRALKALAATTCSLSIARVLLDSGAAVDFRSENSRGNELIKTPLIAAAGRKTREGAEMMRLLLLAGADPNASYMPRKNREPRSAGMELGAKGISKWLGLSWDELVEWAAEQRSKNLHGKIMPRLDS